MYETCEQKLWTAILTQLLSDIEIQLQRATEQAKLYRCSNEGYKREIEAYMRQVDTDWLQFVCDNAEISPIWIKKAINRLLAKYNFNQMVWATPKSDDVLEYQPLSAG